MKILLTGGGTGGHLMPIIAVAREIQRLYRQNNLRLYYIGPNDPLGILALTQENITVRTIVSGKLRRYFSFQNITDILFKIPFGFFQSFFILLFMRPTAVFSKGGTGSLVTLAAARILGIPIFVHESDTIPGISNKMGYKWAKKTFISFEKTADFNPEKTVVTGNPIRQEVLEGSKPEAAQLLHITFEKPVLLFLGGSQGAQPINEFVLIVLNDLLKEFEVIHVCGKKNYQTMQNESLVVMDKDLEKYYHLYESLDESHLKQAYAAADLIISRAGAGSIFEIAAVGKPSIMVPLPGSAQDHQSKNAYQYANTGAAIVMEQQNLTPNFFIGEVRMLLVPGRSQRMKEAALAFAKPLAAKAVAREILEYFNVNEIIE